MGGAVYITGLRSKSVTINKNEFLKCKATIGAAIYMNEYSPKIESDNIFA